jgi:hypothetical protein
MKQKLGLQGRTYEEMEATKARDTRGEISANVYEMATGTVY